MQCADIKPGNTINATMQLWQGDILVDSWSGSGTSTLRLSETHSATKGKAHTALFTYTVRTRSSGRRTTINSNYAHAYLVPNVSLSVVATSPGVGFSPTSGRGFCSSSATVTLA